MGGMFHVSKLNGFAGFTANRSMQNYGFWIHVKNSDGDFTNHLNFDLMIEGTLHSDAIAIAWAHFDASIDSPPPLR